NNRSVSSSRAVGGHGTRIKVEPKVDCRRKIHPKTCNKSSSAENESNTTDRIPKMKLLQVNYVNLKHEEDQSQQTPGIDKNEFTVQSSNLDNHAMVFKEDIEAKNASSKVQVQAATTTVECIAKSLNGGKVVKNTIVEPLHPSTSLANEGENRDCKKSTTSKNQEHTNGEANKSKYQVYKKHNGFGTNSSHTMESNITPGGKLQYINDSDIKIKALAKKKYGLLFENKKKNKLETVQYYFDSRGYERYVDNKLYGVINENKSRQDAHVAQSSSAALAKTSEVQHKRLSWDVRQHNRPSMMRVINQSSAAKKCANVIMMNHQASTKPLSAEAPDTLESGALKQENCRIFKLQKSHTSTHLLTRHKSMNDIHRINQLFLDCKGNANTPSNIPLSNRQACNSTNDCCDPTLPNNTTAVRENAAVHRFEKHKKVEQNKYQVHKRLSARYKTENNLTNTIRSVSGDDTISKRIRQIITGQDNVESIAAVDQQPEKRLNEASKHGGDKMKNEEKRQENVCSKKFQHLSKSNSVEKLLINRINAEDLGELSEEKHTKTNTTCGYKNCKFSNCPMSSSSSSSSASSALSTVSCNTRGTRRDGCSEKIHSTSINNRTPDQKDTIPNGRQTSVVITDNDDMETSTRESSASVKDQFVINNLFNSTILNEKLNNATNGKDMNEDSRIKVTSKMEEIDLQNSSLIIEKSLAHSPQTCKIVSQHKFWNNQNQRNIKLKNNPQLKPYDDKVNINNKIKNEENNSIKIFISSSSAGSDGNNCNILPEQVSLISTDTEHRLSSGSFSSTSSCGSTRSESDKDDGYYDKNECSTSLDKQQPTSIVSTSSTLSSNSNGSSSSSDSNSSSTVCSESTHVSNVTCPDKLRSGNSSVSTNANSNGNRNTSKTSIRLGCDGSLFLNRSYLEEAELPISPATSDLDGDDNEITAHNLQECIGTIDNFSSRPRSIEGPLDSGISISSDTAITNSDSELNSQSQTDAEERKLKRGHVLAELLETERIYVAEMGSILKQVGAQF
uniref:DH domain-containing protein n=1 Tax=Anopheles christyi TaxID=43041 RepID=A0A182JT35_9DIPT